MNVYQREIFRYDYTDAGIKALSYTFPPKKLCIFAHWHERVEMLHVLSGEMTLDVGANVVTLSEGDVAYIPPSSPHRGIAGEDGVKYDVLLFDIRSFYNETTVCKQALSMLYENRASVPPMIRDEKVSRYFDSLCHEIDQNSLETVATLYRLLDELLKRSIILPNDTKNDTVRKIASYIEEHFKEDFDVSDLCQEFGYTAAHLCRKFKAVIGLSPMTYLKICRLEHARELIINTDSSIGEVAMQCGYGDANYFTRCFTAHFGNPPTYFRKTKK